jgi:hypothetical protein
LLLRSRFVVGPCLDRAVFLPRGLPATVKVAGQYLSSSLAFPLEYYPVTPTHPATAGRVLSWALIPYSTCGIAGPLTAGLAHPLRSTFRVWLPSWRLTPCDPLPVLFRTGSAHGIHPSEVSPPGRYPERYHPDEPTYRSTHRCSRRRSGRPAQQVPVSGFLTLPRVPAVRSGV